MAFEALRGRGATDRSEWRDKDLRQPLLSHAAPSYAAADSTPAAAVCGLPALSVDILREVSLCLSVQVRRFIGGCVGMRRSATLCDALFGPCANTHFTSA